jgi:hypothetical protein
VRVLTVVVDAVDRRLAAATDAFDRHDVTALGTERVAALEQAAKERQGA